MLVRIKARVDKMRAGRNRHEYTLGDRLEVGTKVTRAFHHEDFLRRRLDADVAEYLQIVGLHALARDHDAHAADGEQSGRPEICFAPADAGALADEAAVGQPRDAKGPAKWPH